MICKQCLQTVSASARKTKSPKHSSGVSTPGLEIRLYREFPRVPWESHWNGKHWLSSVGMGMSMGIAWWEWEGMKSPHFPFSTESNLLTTQCLNYWRKDWYCIGERSPNLDIYVFNSSLNCLYTKSCDVTGQKISNSRHIRYVCATSTRNSKIAPLIEVHFYVPHFSLVPSRMRGQNDCLLPTGRELKCPLMLAL